MNQHLKNGLWWAALPLKAAKVAVVYYAATAALWVVDGVLKVINRKRG